MGNSSLVHTTWTWRYIAALRLGATVNCNSLPQLFFLLLLSHPNSISFYSLPQGFNKVKFCYGAGEVDIQRLLIGLFHASKR